ncbi:hypothetical protein HG536_0A00570 [Torulaspora globosa]|uniref:Bromo domain-containing protein n=1 Tax=Torulaspora globosa TaxID=48254 RepID=A0A7G3Z9Q4_9SACH|nr:uncharacterized protein HG536_0A00570 [Torulaspora globosa]QLL30240.1 hypothetical protein HG536_0A00570 [Torulaspora globosa]
MERAVDWCRVNQKRGFNGGMSRHLRGHRDASAGRSNGDDLGEIKDGNGIIHTTSRSLRKINYAEVESGLDYLESEGGAGEDVPGEDAAAGYEVEDESPDQEIQRSGRASRRRPHDAEEEDESFHEDEDEDEDVEDDDDDSGGAEDQYYARNDSKRRRRMADRSFVVPDPDEGEDEDEEDGFEQFSRRRRRSARRRQRSATPPPRVSRRLRSRTRHSLHFNDEEDRRRHSENDEEALSLEEEIRELQEDSPIREKRSLRERTKPVNYALPPPLSEANVGEAFSRQAASSFSNASPRRGRGWNAGQNTGPTRRLFPTGGPFGGNDVTAIFGKNTNFYNQHPSAENNKLLLDSDSSEDEILPIGASAKPKTSKKKKKKMEIADLDPLGVDMDIKFSDIGGLDNFIDQLKEMVALPLLYPELYQNFSITPPRGVLFHGPPGTGKTLMARALAASCSSEGRKITFFMRKGADILSKWVGEAERQLRLLFEEAKKQQPAIIFFDEIDGLAPVRSSKQEQIHASIVSTLLALMDGMDNRGQVIVIGATNRPDAVDPALRRPGRFDREFYFPLPDLKARAQILRIHTKKWKIPLSKDFIEQLALLTKGYGGADLRALCTEAALLSIQRKYPQIYRSDEKLLVDPNEVKVSTGDFMLALKKIVPSSARSTGNTSQPLPDTVKPLLLEQFEEIKSMVTTILPEEENPITSSTSLIQHYIDYEDSNQLNDRSGTDSSKFMVHAIIEQISNSRVCNPKLLLTGPPGNGQQYIGAAILNFFERYNVQKLDLASLVSDSGRTIESAIVQSFLEARKRQPSVIYIPNLEIWSMAIPESVILTLSSLLRSLQGEERILLLAVSESSKATTADSPIKFLEFGNNVIHIRKPSASQRTNYFNSLPELLKMKPTFFITTRKRRKPLPKLPLAKDYDASGGPIDSERKLGSDEILRKKLKSFQHQDMRLKNLLKIKLSGLMDLFKSRYKRFRKPPIEDSMLIHLFEPPTDPNWQPAYVKDDNMILEVATGRKFYNMDLDLVEERLWNGYYSEPKQYLKDIELIYRDAATTGDRERIIKASEMFANAQMGVEEMSTSDFIQECKATRQRDLERQELYLRDEEAKIEREKRKMQESEVAKEDGQPEKTTQVGVASGNQLQAQLQAVAPAADASSYHQYEDQNQDQDEDQDEDQYEDQDQDKEDKIKELAEDSTSAGAEDEETPERFSVSDQDTEEKGVIDEDIQNNPQLEDQKFTHSNNSPTKGKDSEDMGDEKPEDRHDEQQGVQESEEESDDEQQRELLIDEEKLTKIVTILVKKTNGFTVRQLEQLYSEIVRIVWPDRFLWEKSKTMEKIMSCITDV